MRHRRSTPRRTAALVVVAVVLAGGAGCVAVDQPTGPIPGQEHLDELTVTPAGPMDGYDRDHFPHWAPTGDNCDVRDEVLQRDGENVQLRGCNVVGGTWRSVYDGLVLDRPSDVDIDHLVPLANAWRSGADRWDSRQREAFANDLTRPQLIAVSATSNRQKGDQDPAEWRPRESRYWCRYAQDWITVKRYWKLTVTSTERDALADMLGRC